MADYAQEFERRAKDAGYEGDDAKVLLAASLNESTLIRLDTYVTASFPGTRADTETIMERLARIPYKAMLGFLKQSSLVDLASQGAGSTLLPTNASVMSDALPKPPPRRALTVADVTPSGAASVSGFAGIFAASADGDQTSSEGTAGQERDKKRQRKGKKGKGKGKG